jgi:hypothetical protein
MWRRSVSQAKKGIPIKALDDQAIEEYLVMTITDNGSK